MNEDDIDLDFHVKMPPKSSVRCVVLTEEAYEDMKREIRNLKMLLEKAKFTIERYESEAETDEG